jgi:hypothetical protein
MDLKESFLKKISYNQRLIVTALANKSEGMLSRELAHKTGVSNKSSIVGNRLKESLAKEGLEIHTERVSRQWLWKLRPIQPSMVAQ